MPMCFRDEDGGSSSSNSGGMKAGKVCAVCGDKALGFNFGAMTCESCKAFFRRNALGKKVGSSLVYYTGAISDGLHFQELRCPFENKCEITQVTRRFCQVLCICLALTYLLLLEFKTILRCFSALSVKEMFHCWHEERKHFEPSRETGEETEDRGKQTEKATNATSSFSKQW